MTIHEERRAELVVALRSGVYKQGTGTLHPGDAYCPLGVACEISKLGEWENEWRYSKNYRIEGSLYGNSYLLPLEVVEYYGWSDPGAKLTVPQRDGQFPNLAHLNDNGSTFSQIADVIEAGLVEEADLAAKSEASCS